MPESGVRDGETICVLFCEAASKRAERRRRHDLVKTHTPVKSANKAALKDVSCKPVSICVCMYVCMYVCMHARTYVCMHVCIYVSSFSSSSSSPSLSGDTG